MLNADGSKVYREVLTSGDTDILAGSELEFAPGDGVYLVRAASTVNTALLRANANRHPTVSDVARAIILRANGEILAEDSPWVLPVDQGEKVVIALSGTTGTAYVEAIFVGDI